MTRALLLAACRPLKPLVPPSLRKQLLVRWLMREEIEHVLNRPSRRWLEAVLLPTLAREVRGTVLSVGVAAYTWHYGRYFRRSSAVWVTNDIDPASCLWGARRHFTCPVQDIHRHMAPGSVQAVVMNGMLGWGLDDSDTYRNALSALATVLADGGVLVTGFYERHEAVSVEAFRGVPELQPGGGAAGLPQRQAMPTEGYVYEVFRRTAR